MKRIPIGIDNYAMLLDVKNDYVFVDKTLLLKEFIDSGAKVSLIVRPRRWGKTLNMSMIQHFFAHEVNGKSTKGLFDNLQIAKVDGGKYLKYQGLNPVIFISLKNIKQSSFSSFLSKMNGLLSSLYRGYENILLNSTSISTSLKELFKVILEGKGSQEQLESSLKTLSECLHAHYNKNVIIIIDEYDTPLNAVFNKPFFEDIVNFLKAMFGDALKGNNSLEKGIMTGILRLSKNKMLSDINNLKLYSLMQSQYSKHFGFDLNEVKSLFIESAVNIDLTEVQRWYNGYNAGNLTTIYNPWSILNCIDDKGALKPYWIKTGDEELLKEVLLASNNQVKEKLNLLLLGKSIETTIDEYISFDQIKQSNNEEVLWSLLWTLGYLKIVGTPILSGARYKCQLSIPNYEIECSYIDVFQTFIRSLNNTYLYNSFLRNFAEGNVHDFVKDLSDYLLKVPSWYDFTLEANYHAFILGLIVSLKETHTIYSNREIGLGRPDILLVSKTSNNNLGIILEFKHEEVGKEINKYEQIANEGLRQIETKQYDIILKDTIYIKQILKLCLVFYGKQFVYKHVFEEIGDNAI